MGLCHLLGTLPGCFRLLQGWYLAKEYVTKFFIDDDLDVYDDHDETTCGDIDDDTLDGVWHFGEPINPVQIDNDNQGESGISGSCHN